MSQLEIRRSSRRRHHIALGAKYIASASAKVMGFIAATILAMILAVLAVGYGIDLLSLSLGPERVLLALVVGYAVVLVIQSGYAVMKSVALILKGIAWLTSSRV